VLLSLHMLQTDDAPEIYGQWRRTMRAKLAETDRRLLEPTPPEGY